MQTPGVAITNSRRMPKEDADRINDENRQIDFRKNKHFKVAKWTVSEVASPSLVGKQPKRSCKWNDVFDGDCPDVDEQTWRVFDKSDMFQIFNFG